MFKNKNKGFSLIELLVAAVILGILATISVPEISRMLKENQYQSDVSTMWSMLNDARAYALASKRCPDGNEAGTWKISTTVSRMKLECISDGNSGQSQEVEVFRTHPGILVNIISNNDILFLPQSAQIKLNTGDDFILQAKSPELAECVEINVNRIAGFPKKKNFKNATCT